MTIIQAFLALALTAVAAGAQPAVLGRCPLERITAVYSGRFVTSDIDDILVLQSIGSIELSRPSTHVRATVQLHRLALLRTSETGLTTAWQSGTFVSGNTAPVDIAGTAWAAGDIDSDGRKELLLLTGDSCRVVSFEPDSITETSIVLSGLQPVQAVCSDVDDNGVADLVLLESSPADSTNSIRLLSLYRPNDSGSFDRVGRPLGLGWGPDAIPVLTGTARLEDYVGELPVVVGICTSLKPSIYGIVRLTGKDTLSFTANPFPWQEWFSKDRVLPAGELSLSNVGDTLVACGYFVPGARPSGASRSFAALQDGEWRLLQLTESAQRLSGPVCRFTYKGVAGWLELRDNLFYFYPGEVFRWQ